MRYDVGNMIGLVVFGDQINQTVRQSSNILKQISDTLFNTRSILVLVIALVVASIIGRLIAALARGVTKNILAKRIDKTQDLNTVNQLRRFETLLVLSVALFRALLLVVALYFWWVYTHPSEKPGALIGASALFALVLGGVLSPVLRDFATGTVMMAERWYGVGDHVTIEPFTLQGIVERVTLRSTKIRSLSGETIWVSNQTVAAVRISPKGVSTMAIELFVSDLNRGLELVDRTNLRLPNGPLMVVHPLSVMTKVRAGEHLWQITAIGETAPERQWLLEKYAIEIMQELDEKSRRPVLQHEPIARFADSTAERRFASTISNARKPTAQRKLNPKRLTDKTKRVSG